MERVQSNDMPLTSPRTTDLDLEDFRRLGVRPNEVRTSVIRRAAARSARGLAEKQLARPSDQRGRQLARVATSTYRLLDPRKRDDVTQRVYVGRILPNTLSWAAQTKFYNDAGKADAQSPFRRDSLSDADLIEMLDLDAAPRLDDEPEPWTTSLSDGDLLETSPWPRSLARVRSRLRYWSVLMALAGVAIGTVLGIATLGLRDGQWGFGSEQSLSASDNSPGRHTSAQPSDASARQVFEPTSEPNTVEPVPSTVPHDTAQPGEQPIVGDAIVPEVDGARPQEVADAEDPDLGGPGEAEPDVAQMPSEPPVDRPVAEPAVDSAIAVEKTEPLSSDSTGHASIDMESKAASLHQQGDANHEPDTAGKDGFLPDPFVSPGPSVPPPEKSAIEVPDLMKPATAAEGEPQPTASGDASNQASPPPHDVPQDASIVASRTQLIALLPQLGSAVRPEDARQRIAAIEAIESDLTVGSEDFWTARMMVAEMAWLVEDVDQLSDRLSSLTENYSVQLDEILSSSFTAACGSASFPEARQHLVDVGLRLANRLIIGESFEPCRSVLDAIGPLAESLESDVSSDYLQQFTQAIDQSERLAESAKRMVNESGEVDTDGDVGIVGRYYCLMLRRWDVGLPWLAEASDPRIAGLARQERRLADAASSEKLIALSQRWFAAAARSSGHKADSMRLHAIDLLRRARSEASGLRKLEIDRLIDVNVELLPPFLRQVPSPHSTEDRATPEPETPAKTRAPKKPKKGLRGRIEIDGQDIGVQLDYELNVVMTGAMLQRVADQLDRTLANVSIKLVGQFELEDTGSVLVSIAPPQPGVSQRVELDDVKLEFDSDDSNAKVAVGAGIHQIVWTIEAEELSRVFLRLRDESTGRRLRVVHPSDASDQPTTLIEAIVHGET